MACLKWKQVFLPSCIYWLTIEKLKYTLRSQPVSIIYSQLLLSALPSSYLNLSQCWVGSSSMWSLAEPARLPSPNHESHSVQKWLARNVWQTGKWVAKKLQALIHWNWMEFETPLRYNPFKWWLRNIRVKIWIWTFNIKWMQASWTLLTSLTMSLPNPVL